MSTKYFMMKNIPDLTLLKYSSLEDSGVSGVLEKHISFLRLLNRKGIVSGVSFHLYYLYLAPQKSDIIGNRLEIVFSIMGDDRNVESAVPIFHKSPLSDFYHFEEIDSIEHLLNIRGIDSLKFNSCSILSKTESILKSNDFDYNVELVTDVDKADYFNNYLDAVSGQ